LRRKTPWLLAISALLAGLLVIGLVAGCGSDQSQARQLVEQAREKSKTVAQTELKLQQKGQQLANFFNTIQNITPDTATAMKTFFNDAVNLLDQVNNAAQKTRTEYQKILELNNAADYKKYANIEIQILDLINRRSLLIKQFAAIYNSLVDAAANGQQIDETFFSNQAKPIVEERAKITSQMDKLNTQAQELAKKLKIQ